MLLFPKMSTKKNDRISLESITDENGVFLFFDTNMFIFFGNAYLEMIPNSTDIIFQHQVAISLTTTAKVFSIKSTIELIVSLTRQRCLLVSLSLSLSICLACASFYSISSYQITSNICSVWIFIGEEFFISSLKKILFNLKYYLNVSHEKQSLFFLLINYGIRDKKRTRRKEIFLTKC